MRLGREFHLLHIKVARVLYKLTKVSRETMNRWRCLLLYSVDRLFVGLPPLRDLDSCKTPSSLRKKVCWRLDAIREIANMACSTVVSFDQCV